MSELVSIAAVIDGVARAFSVSARDLRSDMRPGPLAKARQAAYLLAAEMTSLSSAAIGRHLGDRDHTTVLHGMKRAKERSANDDDYAVMVELARAFVRMSMRSSLGRLARDPDALSAAAKVLAARDPIAATLRLSTIETLMMAARLVDLEQAAAATFGLLTKIDELTDLQPAYSTADRVRWRTLFEDIKEITTTLSGTLASLGYSQEQENGETHQSQNAGGEPARAAE